MVDDEIIREWMNKADEDFDFARINLEECKNFFTQICFHFQQAAEKYLKAYIVAHELEFRKIHELPLLLKICMSRDPSFGELREECEYLTAFYVDTRCPVHWPTNYSLQESRKALQATRRIKAFVKGRMDLS